MMLKMIKFLK